MKELKLNLSGHFNQALEDLGYTFGGTLQIDLSKPYIDNMTALVKYLQGLGVKSDSVVTVAFAGLSSLAIMQLTALHGLTGQFPTQTILVSQPDRTFAVGEVIDLQNMRNNVARTMRENVITL